MEEHLLEIKGMLQAEFPDGHPDFVPLTLEEMDLHSRKNRDYAGGGDPLGNFRRVSAILMQYPGLELTPDVVALVYALKQVDAILWMKCQNREGEVEGIEDRAQDVHVYLKLFRILFRHGGKDGR